jgi:hypothetical protein
MKKAQFGLTLFFAALFIILLGTIVMLFFQFGRPDPTELKYTSLDQQLTEDTSFLAYLQTPVAGTTLSHLIIRFAETEEQKILIEEHTTKIFTALYNENVCWELTADKNQLTNNDCEKRSRQKTSTIIIPNTNGEPITIKLRR